MIEPIIGLAVFGLAVAALFLVITRGVRLIFGPQRRLERDLALEVLRARLARAEISQAEFDQAMRVLGRG